MYDSEIDRECLYALRIYYYIHVVESNSFCVYIVCRTLCTCICMCLCVNKRKKGKRERGRAWWYMYTVHVSKSEQHFLNLLSFHSSQQLT